jgi:response regulator RpfG family c-di-GMP phosphodiesterase
MTSVSADHDDELLFAPEDPVAAAEAAGEHWKILIADDDPEVHEVTKLALDGLRFNGQPLRFLHARSGREAVEMVEQTPDIALLLLDVVMERETAGLDAVDAIRNRLHNRMVRIVLRTGQPGQAPEREVVMRYDINDYKEKTELTAKKLFTLVYTALGQYRDIQRLERGRREMERLVDAGVTVFRRKQPDRLGHGLLQLLGNLLGVEHSRRPPGYGAVLVEEGKDGVRKVLAGSGRYAALGGQPLGQEELPQLAARQYQIPRNGSWHADGHSFIARLIAQQRQQLTLYLESDTPLQVPEAHILDVYCRNAMLSLDNALLHQQLGRTQRELIYMLSEAVEIRSQETGNHARRVGEYSRLLGQLSGLREDEAEVLLLAAPLHDVGKIAIPDAILKKPGGHTEDESRVMRTHAEIGGRMFTSQDLPVFSAAKIIAAQHHERWDGRGYPDGLRGEDIHLYGRISALSDVFDALGSERCYKSAWPLEDILALVREQRGKQFDPELVDLLLGNIDAFLEIRTRLTDVSAVSH